MRVNSDWKNMVTFASYVTIRKDIYKKCVWQIKSLTLPKYREIGSMGSSGCSAKTGTICIKAKFYGLSGIAKSHDVTWSLMIFVYS